MFEKTEAITMTVAGVNDVSSQHEVRQLLRGMRGVRSVTVNRQSAAVQVSYYPQQTTVDELTNALRDAGHPVI